MKKTLIAALCAVALAGCGGYYPEPVVDNYATVQLENYISNSDYAGFYIGDDFYKVLPGDDRTVRADPGMVQVKAYAMFDGHRENARRYWTVNLEAGYKYTYKVHVNFDNDVDLSAD